MDYHTVSEEYTHYFFDYHHVYPEVQGMMANKILGKSDVNIPSDFGQSLNEKNLEACLIRMKNNRESK